LEAHRNGRKNIKISVAERLVVGGGYGEAPKKALRTLADRFSRVMAKKRAEANQNG
jgi:hypothetical protein